MIKVHFDESVYAGKSYGKIALYDQANRRVAVTKRLRAEVLEVTPTKALKQGAAYRLHLPRGAVKDQAGNQLAEDFWLAFTTAPAPSHPGGDAGQ